jgi:hypothetical protein
MSYSVEKVAPSKLQSSGNGANNGTPVNSGLSNSPTKNSVDILAEYDKSFSDYSGVAKEAIKYTMGLWKDEFAATSARRELRLVRVNVETEIKAGNLEADEAWCPIHLVDSNINREQAMYAAYLLKSSRNAIISCVENPAQDTAILERDFTDKSRYNAWEVAPLKTIDGMQTHGWDAIEIVFDTTKPGHFTTEHIGHENLIFPTDTKDFQSSPFVIRLCDYTNSDLIKFVKKKGWNAEQVKKVLDGQSSRRQDESRSDLGDNKKFRINKIEKVFFRNEDDIIMVGWSCSDFCDDWLRIPRPLFIGKVGLAAMGNIERLYETAYPIEPFFYTISENETIMDIMGRVNRDEHTQEAATSLLSSFVTSHRRAAQPYFTSDEANDGTSLEEAQTNIKLKSGSLINRKIKQWQLSASSPELLTAVNTLIGQSQMESGRVNYAVQSNRSTRKTAAEVEMAGNEDNLLSTVQQSLLSIALRNTFTVCFQIYSSRAKLGLITVLPQIHHMVSNFSYIVKPSGDSDVVERQQKTTAMLQTWQIIS